jgi:hypothetical protein
MKREDNLLTIIQILVKRRDLSDGTKANCSECPVAVAANRALRLAVVQGFEVGVCWNGLLQIATKTECTQYVPIPQNEATPLADIIYQVDMGAAWHLQPRSSYQLEKPREERNETRIREDETVNANPV